MDGKKEANDEQKMPTKCKNWNLYRTIISGSIIQTKQLLVTDHI